MEHVACKMNVGLIPEDVLGIGRDMFRFRSSAMIRESISYLGCAMRDSCISRDEYIEDLEHLGVELVFPASDYVFNGDVYDCKDWVFDNLGMSHYVRGSKDFDVYRLHREDLPDVASLNNFKEGSIIMYHNSRIPKHWGIIDSAGDEISVKSKWGIRDVFRHPLENVLPISGDHVMFLGRDRLI